jgi:26S proteasome regulatory subunit N3
MGEPVASSDESDLVVIGVIKESVNQIITATKESNSRAIERVLSKLKSLRKQFRTSVLSEVFSHFFDAKTNRFFQSALGTDVMEVDDGKVESKVEEKADPQPDTKAYLHLLLIVYLIDQKMAHKACEVSQSLIDSLTTQKLSISSPLKCQIFFFYSRCYELSGNLKDIRPTLLEAYRTSFLRHEVELQAVLLNLILRNYLASNLYDSADKFVSRIDCCEGSVSSNQYARFVYYLGKIKAIQLNYKEAHKNLQIAMRKAPQNKALGFRITVSKLFILVELLMGQIPDRELFTQPGFRSPLRPYFELTQSVRDGDLGAFHSIIEKHAETFQQDNLLTLVRRVHHNVTKAGLRKISVAYSRIQISEICRKLGLENERDCEFMVAKAIRDEVINANIVHGPNGAYLQSKESINIYSTQQPQEIFHNRIEFFLQVRNDSVKAMRFPDNKQKIIETEEERKERVKAEQDIPEMLDEEDD